MLKYEEKASQGGKEVFNIWGTRTVNSIIGESKPMLELKDMIKKIGNTDSTVLIAGESGTGKELIARAIHLAGSRGNKTFVAINCAAIPEHLLESELFGYVKGAFSGANHDGKIGKFELANRGVVFLDEIGDMPLNLQSKLLRIVQEKKFTRVGSNELIDIDIRILSATNKDLLKLVSENKFREDLYYRLNVIQLEVPPLRERDEDIFLLVKWFIDKYCKKLNKNITYIDNEVKEMLVKYPWPGNIRELENTIEMAINLVDDDGIIHKGLINKYILRHFDKPEHKKVNTITKIHEFSNESEILSLEEIDKIYIKKVIEYYGEDTKGKKKAAKKLGISLATLYRKLE